MFFSKSRKSVLEELGSSQQTGLESESIQERQLRYGMNVLQQKAGRSVFSIIIDQLKEIMVVILIVAALVSFYLHEAIEGIVILVIVVLNTLLGFWQEYKAQKAMSALKKMAEPFARVRRDGVEQTLPAKELVPGDVMIIEAGNVIAADARILESVNLKVEESTLTGESEPVEKISAVLADDDVVLAERRNMLYTGTIVTYGRGEAVVCATGMKTELGHIADMLQSVDDEKTPLQKRLAKLGTKLAMFAFLMIGVVAFLSYLRGLAGKEIFMTAISIAVAAIPEGLPAVVTIALAMGAGRMLKRKALIRHLPAVETLGSVTVICSDKTGTLTKNEMTVTEVLLADKDVSIDQIKAPAAQLALLCGILCNDAVMNNAQEGQALAALGDPTEGALVIAAHQNGLIKTDFEQALPRIAEFPFDSQRKRMSTLHTIASIPAMIKPALELAQGQADSSHIIFSKGSVDGLMDVCSHVLMDDQLLPLTDQIKVGLIAKNKEKASQGIRVLGMAFRSSHLVAAKSFMDEEKNLVFIGMQCMIDPVRPEAIKAVQRCQQAGIRVVMITGDHPLTASAIGKELGLADHGQYLTGKDLMSMSADEIKKSIQDVSIFARVSPEHKMIIIDGLQAAHEIVSMTGDGVNDAPALKSADIGVAMGITGTDVSKEASDMVLLDDNFVTIVEAVKEGRTIFDNIRKFITYILTGNLGEILVMLIAPFFGMPLPLLPIQILWINLVTDGAPAIALAYEESEADVMQRVPFEPNEGVFSRGIGAQIILFGLVVGCVSLVIGYYFWKLAPASRVWQTMIFTTIAFCQLGLAVSLRKTKETIFSRRFFSNVPMMIAILLTAVLQLIIIYLPFFNVIFKTQPLSVIQLAICMGGGVLVVGLVEVKKVFNW